MCGSHNKSFLNSPDTKGSNKGMLKVVIKEPSVFTLLQLLAEDTLEHPL